VNENGMDLFLVGGSTARYLAVFTLKTFQIFFPICSNAIPLKFARLSATSYLIQLLEGLIFVVKNSCFRKAFLSSGDGCTICIEAVM